MWHDISSTLRVLWIALVLCHRDLSQPKLNKPQLKLANTLVIQKLSKINLDASRLEVGMLQTEGCEVIVWFAGCSHV